MTALKNDQGNHSLLYNLTLGERTNTIINRATGDTITIDIKPNDDGYTIDQTGEMLGLLLPWAFEGMTQGQTVKAALIERYGHFYFGPMEGGKIDETGVYRYPGDPLLQPLVVMHVVYDDDHKRMSDDGDMLIGEIVFFYHYGMVGTVQILEKGGATAFNPDNPQWITRMD